MAISNRYKDTLDGFIDSSNPESPLGPIDKESCNAPRFRDDSTSFLKEDCLNKEILASHRSSQLTSKTGNS